MNLSVHSGPTECKLKRVTLRCPCVLLLYTISPFGKFQYFVEKNPPISPFLTHLFKQAEVLSPKKLAGREGLPENFPYRRDLDPPPVKICGFACLSFPPLSVIDHTPGIIRQLTETLPSRDPTLDYRTHQSTQNFPGGI